jgi:hypothetical protein
VVAARRIVVSFTRLPRQLATFILPRSVSAPPAELGPRHSSNPSVKLHLRDEMHTICTSLPRARVRNGSHSCCRSRCMR